MNIEYQETSREAWAAFMPQSAKLDRLIMQTISEERAITCQAIEGRIKRDHQAVSGNLRHLVEKDLVEASGEYGVTRSGRKAIMWRLTTKSIGPAQGSLI